jgi:PRC-barrel domain protein
MAIASSPAVQSRETTSLIGSDKVEGTAVYGADQKKIGKLERVMIDKISGKVAYAVLSFGGFLGMGEDYYPVPWPTLKYEPSLGGYLVNLTRDKLDKAPKYTQSTGWNWTRENDQRVYDYYGAAPYWGM